MSEHDLVRNRCIVVRNELHVDKVHACCIIRCFNFYQLLYLGYKCTLNGKIHPTDNDSTAFTCKYLYTGYAWIQNHNTYLNSYGVSAQKRDHYETLISMFYLRKKNITYHFWSFEMSPVNNSSENDGYEWEEDNHSACTFKTGLNYWNVVTAIKIVI